MISTRRSVDSGVYGDGLITTVLPARIAGMMCQMAIITGQFHGVIEPTTPIGLAMQFDAALVVVLQHLHRHIERRRCSAPRRRRRPSRSASRGR